MEIANGENITLLPCRACMQFTSTMYPLFEEYEAGISMAAILQSYISSEIINRAKLPNQLCEDCAVTLIKFHNFIVIYRDSQNKFDKWQESCDVNFIDTNDTDVSLENEQIIIQSVGTDEDNDYCLEIKSEMAKNEFIYFEDEVENIKSEESAEIEETINISFEDADELNSEPNKYSENESNSQDTSENVTQYHCLYCNDIFLYKKLLNGHVSKCHNLFKSADIFANTTLIKRRIFIDNDVNNPNYTSENCSALLYQHLCKLCRRSFPTIKSLQIHRSSHKRNKKYIIANGGVNPEEKLFICDVCGRSFKKKAYLNDHVEIHDSVRKLHNCPICHKQFKGRSNFARHKRFHFQDKKQQICEVCGIGFNLRSTLKTHFYLKHVQERNFQCLICSQFFSLKSTLEKHVRRHLYREGSAQAVKFACFACDMKYLDKSSLKRHVELKHSDDRNRFECTDCDKDYTTYTNLAKHRMRQHPEKPVQDGRKRDTAQLESLEDVIVQGCPEFLQ